MVDHHHGDQRRGQLFVLSKPGHRPAQREHHRAGAKHSGIPERRSAHAHFLADQSAFQRRRPLQLHQHRGGRPVHRPVHNQPHDPDSRVVRARPGLADWCGLVAVH